MLDHGGRRMVQLSGRKRAMRGSSSMVGGPLALRFLKLGPSATCSRSGLRGTVVGGVRRFLLRLNGKFLFRTERGEFAFSRRRFFISLIFCGHLLRYCMLVSLGVNGLARRSLKRVRVCIGCCSERVSVRQLADSVYPAGPYYGPE